MFLTFAKHAVVACACLTAASSAQAVSVTIVGQTSSSFDPATSYSYSFTIDNDLFNFIPGTEIYPGVFTADLFRADTSKKFDGIETSLSMVFNGVETFNETTAGIRSIGLTTDGTLSFVSSGGYRSGNQSFSASNSPDYSFNYNAFSPDEAPGAHQLGSPFTQHRLLAPSSIVVTDAPALAPVPLPAAAGLLVSGLAGLRFWSRGLRRR